jgi:hypothetical protein
VRRSAKQDQTFASLTATLARPRLVLTLLMLLSFLTQGYLVQTHIHGLPTAFAADSVKQTVSQSPNGSLPGDDDQATCLLCQEFVQAGNYLTPAAIAVLPPFMAVRVIAVETLAVIAAKPTSHNWRGRAPPHA